MPRVEIADVKEIVRTNLTDVEITAAINAANLYVNTFLNGQTCMTEELLTQIELYLSAHFIVINEEKGGVKSEKIGDAAQNYNTQTGTGFGGTRYGQQAIAFDCSNTLVSATKAAATFQTFPRTLSNFS